MQLLTLIVCGKEDMHQILCLGNLQFVIIEVRCNAVVWFIM
jgi:hypothetical protein